MWGRYGLKDSVVDANGMCYFKFKSEEGMNSVIDQSPCVKGISALASRLGRPIKMDQMTADMCREWSGRLGYARVLVEINAEDEFPDKIKINYVDGLMKIKSTKWVRVEYTWKPSRCIHCKVFGHSLNNCEVRPKPVVESNNSNTNNKNGGISQEGFMEVKNRKNFYNNKNLGHDGFQGNKT
ncbi:RNA-directed DNA polymerase, eukaryota, reverse transcriptase zinc-binding domain protein [Tanacetum coccineum]